MKNEKEEDRTGVLFRFFGASILVIAGVMVLYHLGLRVWLGDSAEARSAFGDQFGALNVLITGVAFFGLMISVAIQSKDLRAQTRALELQQEALQQQIGEFQEQKEELRRTAQAQERSNALAKLGLRADVLKQRIAFNLAKMQAAQNTRGVEYTTPSNRVGELLQELETLVNDDRDQSGGPTDA